MSHSQAGRVTILRRFRAAVASPQGRAGGHTGHVLTWQLAGRRQHLRRTAASARTKVPVIRRPEIAVALRKSNVVRRSRASLAPCAASHNGSRVLQKGERQGSDMTRSARSYKEHVGHGTRVGRRGRTGRAMPAHLLGNECRPQPHRSSNRFKFCPVAISSASA